MTFLQNVHWLALKNIYFNDNIAILLDFIPVNEKTKHTDSGQKSPPPLSLGNPRMFY